MRIGRYLERAGYVERDAENSFLTEAALAANEISEHQSHSVQYRIVMGPQKSKKVFSLQTMVPILATEKEESVATLFGFSLTKVFQLKQISEINWKELPLYFPSAIPTHRLSLTSPQRRSKFHTYRRTFFHS